MTDEGTFTDFSSVRDMLHDAQERRGFLTYEQKAALQHAEWAASDNRNGYATDPKVFTDMFNAIMEIEIFQKYPELAAKLAEIMPMHSDDVRAVIASRRISIEGDDVEAIRQRTETLGQASLTFAERRMDRSIKSALSGVAVSELDDSD